MMGLVVASLALMALAASGARAESVKLGGQTALIPSETVQNVVDDGRLSIRPFSPAKAAGKGFRFPVATGFGDSGTYRGILVHSGGLILSKGKRSLVLKDFVAVRMGSSSQLLAEVRRDRPDCRYTERALRRFPGKRPTAEQKAVNAVAKQCRSERVIGLGDLSDLGRSVANGTAMLSATLRLSGDATELINEVAGKKVLRAGKVFGSILSSVCRTLPCAAPTPAPPPAPPAKTTLGILLPTIVNAIGADDVISEARALGLQTVRTSQNVSSSTEIRPAIQAYQREGMNIILGVNNDPQPDGTGNNPSRPPVTPDELATYKQRLAGIFDRIAPPSLVQVENEEGATRFFSGTMDQYAAELNAAVEVAHGRGLKITNGGITNKPIALLTWQDYKNRGLDAQADDFAARAFSAPADQWILRDLRKQPFTGLSRQSFQDAWDRAKQLIPAFARSDMDYVNFHWYADDAGALSEAVAYLGRATGKPVVTTEVGQYNLDPSVVTDDLTTLVDELNMPVVVWFDADGTPALGLHDAPGVLRPNGLAFKSFVQSRTDRVQ